MKIPLRIKPISVLTTPSGYEHGAPLSDIGEEELTPRSRISRRSVSSSHGAPPSPTPNDRNHKKRMSDEMSTNSDPGDWENFDSSKMMTGRLAADVAKQADEELEGVESKRNSIILAGAEDSDEMAILNAKAERILANARKRLTHMEDNLSKARHSVLWSPRSSPNISEQMHQPAGGLYRSISLASTGRRAKAFPVKTSPVAHSRGSSDTTTNTGLKRLSMIAEARAASAQEYRRRNESPLVSRLSPVVRQYGHSPASSRSVNSPMRTLEEEDDSSSTTKTSPESSAPKSLGLGINTMAQQTQEDLTMRASPTSPTHHVRPTSATSTRSIKDQMSDLRLRIADLKNKTQADKERRQSVQSRNTPSPFTNGSNPENWYASAPGYTETGSPLSTNAGVGWSPNHEKKMSLDAQLTPVTPQASRFLDQEPPSTADTQRFDARTDVNTPNLHKRDIEVAPEVADGEDSIIQESVYEDAEQNFDDGDQVATSEEEQIYLNEVLQESLDDVEPEVPEIPEHYMNPEGGESERHEDRLDAFDYENMFLHSAMGNYTGGARSRSPSTVSETSSVATRRAEPRTRTPTTGHNEDEDALSERGEGSDGYVIDENDDARGPSRNLETPRPYSAAHNDQSSLETPRSLPAPSRPWMHTRTTSVESNSTVATFATATEGNGDESGDEDPYEILSWGNDTASAFPQPPIGSPLKQTPAQHIAGAWPTPPMSTRAPQHPIFDNTTHPHHPNLHILTNNAYIPPHSNGVPTPAQTPLPPSTSNSSRTTSAVASPITSTSYHYSRPSTSSHSTTSTSQLSTSQHSLRSHNLPPSHAHPSRPTTATSTDHPANTEILMESLIKLADPDFTIHGGGNDGTTGKGSAFADVDKDLVLGLLRAVGAVCDGVLKAERRADMDGVRELRRRLARGRGVLEGGLSGGEDAAERD